MACSNCKEDKNIVNKHFKLCLECNNLRLHGSKYGKERKLVSKPIKFNKTPKKSKKFRIKDKSKPKKSLFTSKINLKEKEGLSLIEKDELFYEQCFNSSNHRCEECDAELPTQFRNSEGKIIARWRYSHIIPKSIASHLRHVLKNINHLCITCHTRWDFGDKENMKIYPKNAKKFPNHF